MLFMLIDALSISLLHFLMKWGSFQGCSMCVLCLRSVCSCVRHLWSAACLRPFSASPEGLSVLEKTPCHTCVGNISVFPHVCEKPCKNLSVFQGGLDFFCPSLFFCIEARGLSLCTCVLFFCSWICFFSSCSSNVTGSWQLLFWMLFEIIRAWTVAELCVSLTLSRGNKLSDHNRLIPKPHCILSECVVFVANKFSTIFFHILVTFHYNPNNISLIIVVELVWLTLGRHIVDMLC